MVGLPCIAAFIPIIGGDVHDEAPPFPSGPIPHVVLWFIYGVGSPNTSRVDMSVRTPIGAIACRGHEAGPFVAHIPIPPISALMLPAVLAGSSNKCEFGAGTVKVGAKGYPVAVGLLYAVGPQLDCGLVPAFTGFALSIINMTVRAGFSLADFVASMCAAIYDIVVGAAISYVAGLVGKFGTGLLLDALPVGFAQMAFAIFGAEAFKAYLSVGVGDLIGGPLGWSPSWSLYSMLTTPKSEGGWGEIIPTGDSAFNAGHTAAERVEKLSSQVFDELFGE